MVLVEVVSGTEVGAAVVAMVMVVMVTVMVVIAVDMVKRSAVQNQGRQKQW